MDWYIFSIITGLVVLNLVGTCIFHNRWKKDYPKKSWKCKEFAIWTVCLILFGICYVGIYCIVAIKDWLVSLFRK